MARTSIAGLLASAGIVLVLGGCVGVRHPAPIDQSVPSAEPARFRAKMVHDGAPPELADWETWLTFYYLDPQPGRTVAAMRVLSERGDLGKNPAPIAVFFGRLFAQNPTAVGRWVEDLRSTSEDAHFVTALAIWFSRLDDRDALLQRLGEGGSPRMARYVALAKSDVAPDLTTIEVHQAVELDMLWASFFATGDTRFLERVVRVLSPWMQPGSGAPLPVAARWSLMANAAAHSRVLEFCRQQASREPEREATLKGIVAQAEAERRKPEGTPKAERQS